MNRLTGIEPASVFELFDIICGIPHESGNLDAIADFCVGFAEENGLGWIRDKYNNVIIKKPATKGYEKAEPIILQGHLDMVCEKEAGKTFDFRKNGIEPYIDGDYIRAKGTTLGGDNGIAIAMVLAILRDQNVEHPAIEALFTADEETSMEGAFNLDCSCLSGHRLINLDSEYEGVFMCSCAGGVDAIAEIPIEREAFDGTYVAIKVSGLLGGHSGVEIDKGRANANIVLAKILKQLDKNCRIVTIEGGGKDNAIPSDASAVICCNKNQEKEITEKLEHLIVQKKKKYSTTDPDISITHTKLNECSQMPLTLESSMIVLEILTELPDGVYAMNPAITDLVQTSSNMGILSMEGNVLKFTSLIRSSVEEEKKELAKAMYKIVDAFGGTFVLADDFPGWAFNPKSELKEMVCEAYREVTGNEGKIDAVHAGIECGLFSERIENLDCISIGPDMGNVHTPDEYLCISSTERMFETLKAILKKAI